MSIFFVILFSEEKIVRCRASDLYFGQKENRQLHTTYGNRHGGPPPYIGCVNVAENIPHILKKTALSEHIEVSRRAALHPIFSCESEMQFAIYRWKRKDTALLESAL